MSALQRIAGLLKDDLGALVPGSQTPFGREVFLRLLLYLGLVMFAVGLFLFSPAGRSRSLTPSRGLHLPGLSDPGSRLPEQKERRRERAPKKTDPDSRTI